MKLITVLLWGTMLFFCLHHVLEVHRISTRDVEIKCTDDSSPIALTNDNVFDYDAVIVECKQ